MKFKTRSQDRRWCEDHGLHFQSLRTALSIERQLREALRAGGMDIEKRAADVIAALQKVLVEGSSLTLARRVRNELYRTLIDVYENGGTRIGEIHPSSSLVWNDNFPQYIVYQELVASTRSYFRNCSEVREEDVVEVLKRIKAMKNVKLSGGSELVFYKSNGEKIETDGEVEKAKSEVEKATKSTMTESGRQSVASIV